MTDSVDPKKLLPKLRFPAFAETPGWKTARLGELVTTVVPPKKLQTHEYHSSGSFPIIDQSQSLVAGWTDDRSAVVDAPATLIVFGDHTCVIKRVTQPFAQGADGIKILASKGIDPNFLYQNLSHKPLVMEDYKRHFGTLCDRVVSLPDRGSAVPPEIADKEQRKIAECLQSLDDLIAAETEKLDALKRHKKGLLQQLFPAEGETTPRLRFPQFRKDGEWRQTSVGDLLDILSGFPFDGQHIVADNTGTPLLRGVNITEGEIRHNDEIDRFFLGDTSGLHRFRLLRDDLVIGMDGSKVGKNSALISEADGGALLIQRVARLRSKNPLIARFVFLTVDSERFHKYVDRINTSSGIPHISAKQIAEFPILLPLSPELEMVLYAIETLHSLVTGCGQSLTGLGTHKAALMQQLFPSVDEAEY